MQQQNLSTLFHQHGYQGWYFSMVPILFGSVCIFWRISGYSKTVSIRTVDTWDMAYGWWKNIDFPQPWHVFCSRKTKIHHCWWKIIYFTQRIESSSCQHSQKHCNYTVFFFTQMKKSDHAARMPIMTGPEKMSLRIYRSIPHWFLLIAPKWTLDEQGPSLKPMAYLIFYASL